MHSEEPHRFSVRDDIELTQFGDIYRIAREDVVISPSGHRVVVHTTRASLEDGKLHDQLRIYDLKQLQAFVNAADRQTVPLPLSIIDDSTASSGQDQPLITHIRWLRDESGVAFLLRTNHGERLYLRRIGSASDLPLSPEDDDVQSFDICDESHYVLALASRDIKLAQLRELDAPFRVGTGHRSFEAMFPKTTALFVGRSELWAANGAPPVRVRDSTDGSPIVLYESGSSALALSPKGDTVVTILPVKEISKEWERNFLPPILAPPAG